MDAMRSTIDAAGRLVIPSDIRRAAGLKPGTPLEIRCRDGRIEIEPASMEVDLVRKGRLLVAIARADVARLTHDEVEASRESLRAERSPA